MTATSGGNWQMESVRLSVFLAGDTDPTEMKLWEQLVGSPPEQVQSRPREHSFKEEGPFLDGLLSVETNRNRIDWRLNQSPNNISNVLPILGPYNSFGEEFRLLMHSWLANSPRTNRLGYGAVLLLPAETLPEANNILNRMLTTVDIDTQNTCDFLYRVNRKRHSGCDVVGLEINRLSTWSVASISGIRIDIGPNRKPIQRVVQLAGNTICRLELDINTAPEFQEVLDSKIVPEVFDELVTLGNEIASKGDIP